MSISMRSFTMNMIMRFLCVALMVQISISDIHGMNVRGDAINQSQDEEAGGDAVPLLAAAPSLGCFGKLRRALKRSACCLGVGTGCSLLAVGIAFLIVSTPSSSSLPPFLQCDDVPWDRQGIPCPDNERRYPAWGIGVCQRELMGNDSCVPICFGEVDKSYVMTGYRPRERITKNMNCSEGTFQYVVCPIKKAAEVQKLFEENDISCCSFRIHDGVGLAFPEDFYSEAVDVIDYEKHVVPNPSYMNRECAKIASNAKFLGVCKGPFSSNATDTKKQRRKKQKHKRRS